MTSTISPSGSDTGSTCRRCSTGGRVTLAEIEPEAVAGIADPHFLRRLEGQDRLAARALIVAELERLGLLVKTEPHVHQVPHAQRGGAVVEPLLTTQWFCNAAELAEARDRGGRDRPHAIRAQAMGEHLLRLDAPGAALVHQPPALVGPSHPRLVRAGRHGFRRDERGGGARRRDEVLRRGGRRAHAGRGRARHLVQLGALADVDARLARAHAGARALLPGRRARHRLRHHLLLGRPHDDAGHALHEGRAVPHRLHPRPRARRARQEDVEDDGQRHRPARAHRRIRRGCAALRDLRADRAGARHQARREERREPAQLRHQAVERRALLRDERRRAGPGIRSGRRAIAALPLGARRREQGGGGGERRARSLSVRRLCGGRIPLHLERVLRLVPGILEARSGAGRERRGARGEGDRRPRARHHPAPAAPRDALRHRGTVGPVRLRRDRDA